MDLQQTFDTIVQHLRRQGHRAVNETGYRCEYLAPDGSRCAVGALIPDGHPALKPGIGLGVEDLLSAFPDLCELIAPTRDHVDLLCSLQCIHDWRASWTDSGLSAEGWERLRRVARSFNLDDSVTRPLLGAG
jgi:hypothetical protein